MGDTSLLLGLASSRGGEPGFFFFFLTLVNTLRSSCAKNTGSELWRAPAGEFASRLTVLVTFDGCSLALPDARLSYYK